MKLAIYGAGGLGREVYDIAVRQNSIEHRWDEIFFVVDNLESTTCNDTRLTCFHDLANEQTEFECIVAIGEPEYREVMYNKLLQANYKIATIIDPTAIVSPTARIGQGCIICEFVSVHSEVELGENCLIQPYCLFGHHIKTGKHCVFSPQFTPGGSSTFGNKVFAGMNSSSKEKLIIGDEAVIAMGAAVFSDIPEGVTVVGNPARVTIRNKANKVFK